MSVNNFKELIKHVGHKIVCVQYGKEDIVNGGAIIENVAIECETCYEVILDFDKEC